MKNIKLLVILLTIIGCTVLLAETKVIDKYQKGHKLFKAGKPKEALKLINEVLSTNPYHKAALACRVDIQIQNREWETVVSDLTQLIKIDPKSDFLYTKRSFIYQLLDKNKLAMKDLESAVKINPTSLPITFEKAKLLVRMKKDAHAIVELTKIIDVSPRHTNSFILRSSLWALDKDIENAIADLNSALAIEPQNPEALNSMAWFLATWPDEKIRNGKKSIELATLACEVTKWNNIAIIDTLAAAYAEDGQFKKAIEYMNMIIPHTHESMKEEIEGHLEAFKNSKPHREYAQ